MTSPDLSCPISLMRNLSIITIITITTLWKKHLLLPCCYLPPLYLCGRSASPAKLTHLPCQVRLGGRFVRGKTAGCWIRKAPTHAAWCDCSLPPSDAAWADVSGSAEERKQHLEESNKNLDIFKTTELQLGQWLSEKELMMSVLGPLSIDPNMLKMQKQQVQVRWDKRRAAHRLGLSSDLPNLHLRFVFDL